MNLLTEEQVTKIKNQYDTLDRIGDTLLILGGILILGIIVLDLIYFCGGFSGIENFTALNLIDISFIILYAAIVLFCARDFIYTFKLNDLEYTLKHNRNVAIIKNYEQVKPDDKDMIRQLKNYSRECGPLAASKNVTLGVGVGLTMLFTTIMFVCWQFNKELTVLYVLCSIPLIIGVVMIVYAKTTATRKIKDNMMKILKYRNLGKKEEK